VAIAASSDHLHLLRMQAIDDPATRKKLTDDERAHLLPLYKAAQLYGSTERGRERIKQQREAITKRRDKAIRAANALHDGLLWLMDRGINTNNVIYYENTERFGFGWQRPVDAALLSDLLDVISEFPFAYDIKCADGRVRSGG